jgi:hypothetical protein
VDISCRHVERIAAELGRELARQRDDKAARQRKRQLPVRVATTPEVVAVEVDGGRFRSREPGCGPGVHQAQNKEDKVACLVTLQSGVQEQDPQPEPPDSFLEPRRVQRLVQQMKGQAGEKPQEEKGQEVASEVPQEEKRPEVASNPQTAKVKAGPPQESPRRLVRTCVASTVDSRAFGPMVAAAAKERDFYRAQRRAFLGDGAKYNWWIQRAWFKDFEPIVDFLHVLCYLYLAAWAVGDEAQRWSIYVNWLRACWQGRVTEVIAELAVWQGRLGVPGKGEKVDAKDARLLVAEALSYLRNNASRMDYPRYRKEGLPVTSSLAESLVGEFNARVKSRQKYWNRPEGAEAILQLRAAVLSEDDQLERYFRERAGCARRRRQAA